MSLTNLSEASVRQLSHIKSQEAFLSQAQILAIEPYQKIQAGFIPGSIQGAAGPGLPRGIEGRVINHARELQGFHKVAGFGFPENKPAAKLAALALHSLTGVSVVILKTDTIFAGSSGAMGLGSIGAPQSTFPMRQYDVYIKENDRDQFKRKILENRQAFFRVMDQYLGIIGAVVGGAIIRMLHGEGPGYAF